ncbi:MAG: HupE/UreJ family protein [Gammaproteobacteria bacterium]|nr:HupE/UreJ family protein [Gammaproteobacteria bacterium]
MMVISGPAQSHEVRPGYLELRELAPESYSVLWKVPMKGDLVLSLTPVFPRHCQEKTEVSSRPTGVAMINRWTLGCEESLSGNPVSIDGLEKTLTDVLVRIERQDGNVITQRLSPGSNTFTVPESESSWQVAMTYLVIGIEHILLGIDHLLFVLALLLIVGNWRVLIATITAFTVAHSITLAAATLGYVHVPQQPVEAVIALSILFLASEIMHMRRGHPGLARRWPWLVAFIFGLLHGFGFAGALTEVGLPENAIPLALLFFNIGVEVGQLLFVASMVLMYRIWRMTTLQPTPWVQALPVYAIGSIAAFWTIERVASFWS